MGVGGKISNHKMSVCRVGIAGRLRGRTYEVVRAQSDAKKVSFRTFSTLLACTHKHVSHSEFMAMDIAAGTRHGGRARRGERAEACEKIRRREVLQGPSAAAFGAGAFTGSHW